MTPAEAAALLSLGRLHTEHLPAIATAFLIGGWDTDAVARAAMPETRAAQDVRDLFVLALQSLDVPMPSYESAIRGWLRDLAERRASGALTVEEAAREITEGVS